MFADIQKALYTEYPHFPQARRPRVGAIIKDIRVDRGIRQLDFALEMDLNLATLKSIENDHQKATTADNLMACAKTLNIAVDDLVLQGRELDPANFFALKRTAPQAIKGIRKRKQMPVEWRQSTRLRFKDFDVTPVSAPIFNRKDFFLVRINLPPKRAITGLKLDEHEEVLGFIHHGFNLIINQTGNGPEALTTNQGFSLDGFYAFDIRNEDEDNAAVIYLMTKLTPEAKGRTRAGRPARPQDTFNIALAIEKLRAHVSDRPNQPISIKHLADLTNRLDHEQITKMMRLKKGSSVIYWEKIEDLLGGTGISMEKFLGWAHAKDMRPVNVTTARRRSLIDYGTYYGMKIYSATASNERPAYFAGELRVDGKAVVRRNWERKDHAMIACYVEDGDLEITVGKRRGPLPLTKGESLYFDGSLGYSIRNPTKLQTKAFFATYPGIAF